MLVHQVLTLDYGIVAKSEAPNILSLSNINTSAPSCYANSSSAIELDILTSVKPVNSLESRYLRYHRLPGSFFLRGGPFDF